MVLPSSKSSELVIDAVKESCGQWHGRWAWRVFMLHPIKHMGGTLLLHLGMRASQAREIHTPPIVLPMIKHHATGNALLKGS